MMPTKLHLSEAELQMLNKQRFQQDQILVQRRLHCVYIKAATDLSNVLIGQLFDVHPNQVGQYMRRYQNGGMAALCRTGYGTNHSALDDYAEAIIQDFHQQPPMHLAEARNRIIALTGIARDISRVRAFLKRHGFRYLKSGHIPGKVNPEQQACWLKQELQPHIEATKAGQQHLLFMDAAHFVLGSFACCMWVLKRFFLRSGAGRNRINVLGAVHAITKEVSTTINTSYINAEVIMDFLLQLKQRYADLPITIVLDNARYQHCKIVKAWAQQLGISLLFLPAYSPNLNIIERLWKFAKKTILYGKYFDSPALFHATVYNFFETINEHHYEPLNSLLNLKFQTFDYSRIYTP